MQNFSLTQTPGPIQGIVTDSANNPIAGAAVSLSSGATTATSATGAYLFASVLPGTYTVTASAPNYNAATAAGLVLANAGSVTRNLVLTQTPGTIAGVVTNAAGTPLSGIAVVLSNGRSSTTSATGAYQFTSVTPGSYGLTAAPPYYNAFSAAGIVLLNAGTTTYNITLTQTPGTMQGVVTDNAATPSPIAGATVTVTNGTTSSVATTSATGAYVIAGLTPGVYSATVAAATYTGASASGISVPNAGSTTKNFALTPVPGSMNGIVNSVSGTPIAGAKVLLSNGLSATTRPDRRLRDRIDPAGHLLGDDQRADLHFALRQRHRHRQGRRDDEELLTDAGTGHAAGRRHQHGRWCRGGCGGDVVQRRLDGDAGERRLCVLVAAAGELRSDRDRDRIFAVHRIRPHRRQRRHDDVERQPDAAAGLGARCGDQQPDRRRDRRRHGDAVQ